MKKIKNIYVQGFSEEPFQTIDHVICLLIGLLSYPLNHKCDLDDSIIHKTDIGKIVAGPYAIFTDKKDIDKKYVDIMEKSNKLCKNIMDKLVKLNLSDKLSEIEVSDKFNLELFNLVVPFIKFNDINECLI